MALLPGDRFVLRGFARTAIGATLGGGTVLDVSPPHRRRSDAELVARARASSRSAMPETDVRVRVRRAGLAGTTRAALARETGRSARRDRRGDRGAARGALATAGECVLDAGALARIEHEPRSPRSTPITPSSRCVRGCLRARCAARCPSNAAARSRASSRSSGSRARACWSSRPTACGSRSTARRSTRAAQKACDAIAALLAAAALEAPALREVAAHVGLAESAARDLLAHLEREHRLVRARPDLWFDARAIDALRQRVLDHFASRDELDTPAYKALIGTSRRTAVPLMELFDAERLTVRVGEVRRLRTRRAE